MKRHAFYIFAIILLAVLSACGPSQAELDGTETQAAQESILFKIDLSMVHLNPVSYKVSPDGYHLTFEGNSGEEAYVVNEGGEGQHFENIGYIVYSPDSKRMAYSAEKDGQEFIVLDDVEGQPYDYIIGLQFSPDSKRFAYKVGTDGQVGMVIDGLLEKLYTGGIGFPGFQFSPDGKRWMYDAKVGDKVVIVIDGKESELHDRIRGYGFSPDSQRYAYSAKTGDQHSMVIEGIDRGKSYDFVQALVFSPDSQRTAYVAEEDGEGFVVLDGVEGKRYEDIRGVNIQFSPDSLHLAYIAKEGQREFLVHDGIEGDPYFVIEALTLSPNSNRIGFMATDFDGIEQGWRFVVDDEIGPLYSSKDTSVFVYSPINRSVRFSPDSDSFAYIMTRDGMWFYVVNGNEEKRYDSVDYFSFSPDGQHYAYVALRGEEVFVVVDGVEGKAYDGIFAPDEGLVFNSENNLHYLSLIVTDDGIAIFMLVEEEYD